MDTDVPVICRSKFGWDFIGVHHLYQSLILSLILSLSLSKWSKGGLNVFAFGFKVYPGDPKKIMLFNSCVRREGGGHWTLKKSLWS
jgi:hypothetical protein